MSVLKKPNQTLYKSKNNSLQIDKRLKTYDYEFQLDRMSFYVFNNDLKCMSGTDLKIVKGRNLVKHIFPTDLCDFMEMLIKNTLIKTQMIHVQLNNSHVLYTTQQCLDHLNNIVSVILYEIPFSNVQSMTNAILNGIEEYIVHFMIQEDGTIFSVEHYSWNKYFRRLASKFPEDERDEYVKNHSIENVLHKNLSILLDTEEEIAIYNKLIKHVGIHTNIPLRFVRYFDSYNDERKVLITISTFLNHATYFLFRKEILEEVEVEVAKTRSGFQFALENEPYNTELCVFCKRLTHVIDSKDIKNYSKHVMYYHKNIPPLYDEEYDVPCFGKRGRCGQQSYKVLSERTEDTETKVWLPLYDWNNRNNLDETIVKKTICVLCSDEWDNFFTTLQ
jgi:hypothetical protein